VQGLGDGDGLQLAKFGCKKSSKSQPSVRSHQWKR
jgi:hypothetical protein